MSKVVDKQKLLSEIKAMVQNNKTKGLVGMACNSQLDVLIFMIVSGQLDYCEEKFEVDD